MRLQPHYVTELRSSSDECEYCEEGAELEYPHAHAFYVQREGASTRTADELADIFVRDVAELIRAELELEESEPAPYVVPAWLEELEVSGWLEDADDSQQLSDEIPTAESALCEAGFYVVWDDGFNIVRILEPCAVCAALCYLFEEEHATGWAALEDGDSLSYAPILHDHRPAEELEELAPYARAYLLREGGAR